MIMATVSLGDAESADSSPCCVVIQWSTIWWLPVAPESVHGCVRLHMCYHASTCMFANSRKYL